MKRTIEIMITANGNTLVQTRGFSGTSCRQASKFLEESLGQRVSESLTAEYYRSEPAQEKEQQRNRPAT